MALLKFLKGNYSNLSNAAINEGQILICNDTAEMFVDVAADKRIKIGDFITVANLTALEAMDATTVPTSRLYYVEEGNILARSNGAAWIQVNKQPTAEEMKTLLGLGSMAYKSEVAEGDLNADLKAKVDAWDGAVSEKHTHTFVDTDVEDAISKKHSHTFVESELNKVADGDVEKWGVAYAHSQVAHAPADAQANIIESVKVNGTALKITDKTVDIAMPTGALAGKDEVAKTDLAETLVAEIDGKVASVSAGDASITIGGTATAPTVAAKISAADGNALTLAEDGLKVIIPESTKVEASETNGNIKVDGEEVTVYAHPEKHTITEVDGLETALADKETAGAAAQALTDAKAYVDTEDKFVTDILTVDKFGGIDAGSDLNGMTTHEILNALLYPYIAFVINSSSRSAAAATLENGATQTLSSATISVTKKSKPITSIKLLNGSTVLEEKTGDAVAAGGTITFSNLGITVTKDNNPNLKFTVTDGTTSTDKNVGASTFVYPYYMGECAANATIDETLIEGLTKKVESKGNKTVTHSCENGRMVIAYPKAHGVLKSILDPNNFETIGDYTRSEVSITGLDGTTQTYYVYASGAATVSGFKVQYKY
jgi:hypothetical protein